jgi:hypothetical protein
MAAMWQSMTQNLNTMRAQQMAGAMGSSVPQIQNHSASGTPNPNAKRPRSAVLDHYKHGNFELFPQMAGDDASQQSASSNDVMVFAHSGSSPAVDPKRRRALPGSPIDYIPPGGYLGSLKRTSTDEDVYRANACSIISGERNIGKVPRDFLTNNLFTANPGAFATAVFGMINGQPIDNISAGITGHSEEGRTSAIIERIRAKGRGNKYFTSTQRFDEDSSTFFDSIRRQ